MRYHCYARYAITLAMAALVIFIITKMQHCHYYYASYARYAICHYATTLLPHYFAEINAALY